MHARKTLPALLALFASAVAFAFGAGAAAPERAQAFAWKDTCVIRPHNNLAPGAVRPILLTAMPPDGPAYALFTVQLATGLYSGPNLPYEITGVFLTGGCSMTLTFSNPGDTVKCAANAPTTGRNFFACTGNSTWGIERDDDDIVGNVYFPKKEWPPGPAAARPAATVSKAPKPDPGALRKADLSGTGWRRTADVADVGRFGRLLEAGTLPASCDSGKEAHEPVAEQGGSGLFVRRGGAEAVGALDGLYRSAGKSTRALSDAISEQSLRCLARLLSADGHTATLTAQRPRLGAETVTRRIVVRDSTAKRSWRGYLDLVGIQRGKRNAVLVFFNTSAPAAAKGQIETVAALSRRLANY